LTAAIVALGLVVGNAVSTGAQDKAAELVIDMGASGEAAPT
jgi:hypothetical protein